MASVPAMVSLALRPIGHLAAWLTLQFRYLVFHGPCKLIVQGTRDPFGTREEVAGYTLADAIEILWLEDGDHDLKPRKRVSGETQEAHRLGLVNRVVPAAELMAAGGGRGLRRGCCRHLPRGRLGQNRTIGANKGQGDFRFPFCACRQRNL